MAIMGLYREFSLKISCKRGKRIEAGFFLWGSPKRTMSLIGTGREGNNAEAKTERSHGGGSEVKVVNDHIRRVGRVRDREAEDQIGRNSGGAAAAVFKPDAC